MQEFKTVTEALDSHSDPVQDAKYGSVPKDAGVMWKIVHLDPALWRAAVVAVFAVLLSFGFQVSDNTQTAILMLVMALAAIAQGAWTRGSVTPNAKVVVYKPDPVDDPSVVKAGEAVSTDLVAVANAAADTPGQEKNLDQLPFPERM